MKVSELTEKAGMRAVTPGNPDAEIKNCYLCDMLSFAMARACAGDAWITVQTNINVVAVASLAECACVIVPESIAVEPPTVERANEHGVAILSSDKTAFEIAYLIGKNICG